jgi:hypothetical protein
VVQLPSGSTARLDLVARSPAWINKSGARVQTLAGDDGIADAAPGEQVFIAPLPTVLLRDPFE